MKVYIGCSGFHYSGWRKKFYPEKLPMREWLSYYSKHFNTVEINNTFYKMPEEKSLLNWVNKTPSGFMFTIKANRYFTHQKKLVTDDEFRNRLDSFNQTVKVAGDKLGCVLWQFPGNLHRNESKLEDFFKLLDQSINHVVEFRHNSWFADSVFTLLTQYNISFCMLSAPGNLPETVFSSGNVAYLRFHGKTRWYNYHYSEEELNDWYARLNKLKNVKYLYTYFNNDNNAWAVDNALLFNNMFSRLLS